MTYLPRFLLAVAVALGLVFVAAEIDASTPHTIMVTPPLIQVAYPADPAPAIEQCLLPEPVPDNTIGTMLVAVLIILAAFREWRRKPRDRL